MDRIENIDFCIRYLLEQNHMHADIPATLPERQRLLRALMNVTEVESIANSFTMPRCSNVTEGNIWEPQPLSEAFLRAQDAELQAQLQDKGIIDCDKAPMLECESGLSLWQGDITRLKVDAIVNAANSQGLGCWHPLHACIDNAIHSAAGLQLRQACNNILRGGEIDTGNAIITPGYNLPSKYVIHTVGPIIATGNPIPEQERQLAACYRKCLELAETNGCRSIAFCCISTGEFRFPNRRAAEIAVEACRGAKTKVIFNVFKDIDYAIYRQLLGKG